MAPDQTFPALTALVFLPMLGALAVALAGRAREGLASWLAVLFAGISGALALWIAVRGGAGVSELYPWIPTLGVSFALEIDGLSTLLVVWVGLATLLGLVATLPGSRVSALVLILETSVFGLLLSADVFVAFACLGVAVVSVALLSGSPRSVLVPGAAGMTLLFGWFARLHHMVFEQTGFASTALARWHSLALYPSEERSLFLLGAIGVLLLFLAFALAIDNASRGHRALLFAVVGVIGLFLVIRFLVPLTPRGAAASASSVVLLALVVMASSGLARGWTLLAVGYQALVVFGLFSFQESIVAGATLMMIAAAIGFFGLAVTGSRTLARFFVALLVTLPIVLVLVPLSRGDALWAIFGTLAFAAMGYRLVRLGALDGTESTPPLEGTNGTGEETHRRRAGIVSFALAVVSIALLALGWSGWLAHVRPATTSFIGASVAPEDEP